MIQYQKRWVVLIIFWFYWVMKAYKWETYDITVHVWFQAQNPSMLYFIQAKDDSSLNQLLPALLI